MDLPSTIAVENAEWIALIVGLSLVEALYFSGMVGKARGDHGVDAPKTTGNEIFERHYRVQQNHIEQLIIFIPAIWLCAAYASSTAALVLGVIFLIARPVYGAAYVKDPGSRTIGFLGGYISTVLMLLAGIGGIIADLI